MDDRARTFICVQGWAGEKRGGYSVGGELGEGDQCMFAGVRDEGE